MINALEQKGLARTPGRAEPGGAVGRHRELPRRRRISDPGAGRARHGHHRLQALRRRPRLHADRAQRRPDQPEDRAGGQPARLQPYGHDRRGLVGAAADRAPRLDHGRAARRPELRDRRPAAEHQHRTRSAAAALARRHAGARRAVPQRVLPEERDRSRHHRHAASGAAGAAGRRRSRRRSTPRCRPTTSTCS